MMFENIEDVVSIRRVVVLKSVFFFFSLFVL